MDEVAVINASPLIFLCRANRLLLLREFAARIFVPMPVAEEVFARGKRDVTARAIEGTPWIETVPSPPIAEAISSWGLGAGESSVLAVAAARPGTTAIVDDLHGRKCAGTLGIPVRGTLGIILVAKQRGLIPEARPVLEELTASGLYLRRQILDEALRRVGE